MVILLRADVILAPEIMASSIFTFVRLYSVVTSVLIWEFVCWLVCLEIIDWDHGSLTHMT